MRYRVVKDKITGEALVERIEPFFELPIVLYTFASRKEACAKVGDICLRRDNPQERGALDSTQVKRWPWEAYKV